MALSDEQFEKMYDTTLKTHAKILEYEKRGCKVSMDKIDSVAIDLEKNTREHIRVKGFLKAATGLTVLGSIALYWKKLFGV